MYTDLALQAIDRAWSPTFPTLLTLQYSKNGASIDLYAP